jgi:hypothetical protein
LRGIKKNRLMGLKIYFLADDIVIWASSAVVGLWLIVISENN